MTNNLFATERFFIIQKTPLSEAKAKEFAGFSMGKNAQSYFFMECFSQKPTAAATKPTTVSVIFTIHAKSMDACVIWNTCFSPTRLPTDQTLSS